jgi:hypothetical protein
MIQFFSSGQEYRICSEALNSHDIKCVISVLWEKTVCRNLLTFHSNLLFPLSVYINKLPKISLVFLHSLSQSPLHQSPSLLIYSPTLSMIPHLFPEYCLNTLFPPPPGPALALFQSTLHAILSACPSVSYFDDGGSRIF